MHCRLTSTSTGLHEQVGSVSAAAAAAAAHSVCVVVVVVSGGVGVRKQLRMQVSPLMHIRLTEGSSTAQ